MEMESSSPKTVTGTGQITSGLTVRPDWQLGCSELKQRGGHLLQTGNWADCSFLVGPEPRQTLIKAHKLILACASPVFEAMFYGGMAERDGPIRILDVHPDAFKTLLLYIYTDRTVISSFSKACVLYYAAKKYMLPFLEHECTLFISHNLDVRNVCRAYELAHLFDENNIKEQCLKLMEVKTKEIVVRESFLDIDISTLNTLLSLEHLSIESELDLFNAVERYAKVHFKGSPLKRRSEVGLCTCSMKRNKIEPGDESLNFSARRESGISVTDISMNEDYNANESCQKNEVGTSKNLSEIPATANTANNAVNRCTEGSVNPSDEQTTLPVENQVSTCDADTTISNLSRSQNDSNISQTSLDDSGIADRESLRSAIGKIRFLTLTAPQFAAGPARSPLLSESEAFAVLMNILDSASDVPMPKGFSTSKMLRNQQTLSTEAEDRRAEAVFRFTVLNVKARRRSVTSRPFALHDAPWTLALTPRHEVDTAVADDKYYAVYLRCNAKKDTPFAFKVKAEIRLLAQGSQKPDVVVEIKKTFTNKSPEWGVERFVEWSALLQAERGLLCRNALVLEARVRAQRLPAAQRASAPAASAPAAAEPNN